jgi:hypothetical protein
MVSKWNHHQMAEAFMLVNYYNLPRYVYISIVSSTTRKSLASNRLILWHFFNCGTKLEIPKPTDVFFFFFSGPSEKKLVGGFKHIYFPYYANPSS